MSERRYDTPPKNKASLEQRLRNLIGGDALQLRARREALAEPMLRAARLTEVLAINHIPQAPLRDRALFCETRKRERRSPSLRSSGTTRCLTPRRCSNASAGCCSEQRS